MPQIIPIKDLKNTATISQRCHETNEPIFVTKNGYGDLVVMSVQHYEEQMARMQLFDALAQAELELENGKGRDAFEALAELRQKHGV